MKTRLLAFVLVLLSTTASFSQNVLEIRGNMVCTPNPIPTNMFAIAVVDVASNATVTDYYDLFLVAQAIGQQEIILDKNCNVLMQPGTVYTITFGTPVPVTLPDNSYVLTLRSARHACSLCDEHTTCQLLRLNASTGVNDNLPIYVSHLACSGWSLDIDHAAYPKAG